VTYDPPLCGASTYDNSTVVTLTAVPSEGYQFERWTGDVDGVVDTENSTIEVVMSNDRIIKVNFTAPGGLRTVIVEASPAMGGFVTMETPCGSLTSDSVQGAISFGCSAGTAVTLEAAATEGYRFRGWKGNVSIHQDNVTLTADSSKTVIAYFSKPSRFAWPWVVAGIAIFGVVAFISARLMLSGRR
jgi:hypothetical protein